MELTSKQIAELTGGELLGPGDLTIQSVETADRAGEGQLTFIGDARHARTLGQCRASVVLIAKAVASAMDAPVEPEGRAHVIVDDADVALARALEALAPPLPAPQTGVHPNAIVDPAATIGEGARIGPFCVVGPGARIGRDAALFERVSIMADASIGDRCTLWPGVVVRERCAVGDGSILHANVVVGADGFGYRPAPDGSGILKIPQIGTVRIGRDCEIGAGTCIDRAKFAATEIGDGCKIDNLVQIAHNCRLGRGVVIAGQSGLAGSIVVGDGVQIGGAADVRDHLTLGAGARIAGGAQVMNDVPPGETWAGSPAQEYRKAGREYAAVRQLPEVMKQVRKQLRDR